MKKEEEDVFAGLDFGELVDLNADPASLVIDTKKDDDNSNSLGLDKEDDDSNLSLEALLLAESKALEDNDEDADVPHQEEDKKDKGDDPPLNDIDSDESEEASSSTLNAVKIAKAFYEEGGLSSFDEEEFLKIAEEESPGAALMKMLKKEVDYNIEEYKKSLSPEEQARAEAQELGVDPNELQVIQNDIQILSNISDEQLEDADTRAKILKYYYQTTTKFSDSRIEKEIKRLEDLEEAEDEVKNAIPELIKTREADLEGIKTKAKEYQNSLIQKEQERVDKYKTYISDIKEIIPGVKVNKPTLDKIQDAILKPVKEENGRKLNAIWAKREADPIKFDSVLAYLMLEGVFDGKWSGVTSKAKTKAFEELESSLRTSKSTGDISGGNLNKNARSAVEEMKALLGKK